MKGEPANGTSRAARVAPIAGRARAARHDQESIGRAGPRHEPRGRLVDGQTTRAGPRESNWPPAAHGRPAKIKSPWCGPGRAAEVTNLNRSPEEAALAACRTRTARQDQESDRRALPGQRSHKPRRQKARADESTRRARGMNRAGGPEPREPSHGRCRPATRALGHALLTK